MSTPINFTIGLWHRMKIEELTIDLVKGRLLDNEKRKDKQMILVQVLNHHQLLSVHQTITLYVTPAV